MAESEFAAPKLTQVLDSVIFGGGQFRTQDSGFWHIRKLGVTRRLKHPLWSICPLFSILVYFSPLWSTLVYFGPFYSTMVQFGPLWSFYANMFHSVAQKWWRVRAPIANSVWICICTTPYGCQDNAMIKCDFPSRWSCPPGRECPGWAPSLSFPTSPSCTRRIGTTTARSALTSLPEHPLPLSCQPQ